MAKKKVRRKKKVSKYNVPEEKWADKKVRASEKILRQSHVHDEMLSRVVFWSTILVMVVGNLMISFALVPFLVVLNRWFLDGVILILGLVMGLIFNFLMSGIGNLERHHKIIAGFLIPTVAIVNVVFIVLVANRMMASEAVNNIRHNPYLIGILYAAAFLLPYLYHQLRKIYK